jgi:hypothetical protein
MRMGDALMKRTCEELQLGISYQRRNPRPRPTAQEQGPTQVRGGHQGSKPAEPWRRAQLQRRSCREWTATTRNQQRRWGVQTSKGLILALFDMAGHRRSTRGHVEAQARACAGEEARGHARPHRGARVGARGRNEQRRHGGVWPRRRRSAGPR